MQKLFQETLTLDDLAREQYELTQEIMMEHAANRISQLVRQLTDQKREEIPPLPKIVIFCGAGNNGADGYALARMLQADFNVIVYEVFPAKTALALLQKRRALKVGVTLLELDAPLLDKMSFDADIYIDAILGASQKGEYCPFLIKLIAMLNEAPGIKIACDLPTGMPKNPIKADYTVTMGALKERLFFDDMKDFIGEVIVADLGISRHLYERETASYLLELKDLKLPHRNHHDSHKGSYGFVSIIKGDQSGASILAAKAAMTFGAGITALVGDGDKPFEIMQMSEISPKTTAVAAGMGLGNKEIDIPKLRDYPIVIDADLFTHKALLPLIKEKKDLILTPHPKEFSALLDLVGLGNYTIAEIQQNRFALVRKFTQEFPVVLVLKGANTLIAQGGFLYVSTLGTNHLAKGGSGDVLAGMITALLGQGYLPIDAAIQGVLAHSIAARGLNMNDYAMTPLDLIAALKTLA